MLIILGVAIIPLVFLGETIYYRFAKTYEAKVEDQVKYRARSQSDAVEVFLRERTAILTTIVDTQAFDNLKQQEKLPKYYMFNTKEIGRIINTIDSIPLWGSY